MHSEELLDYFLFFINALINASETSVKQGNFPNGYFFLFPLLQKIMLTEYYKIEGFISLFPVKISLTR